ncbi:hypothetical protein OJ998_31340, partial [Solirubrobacter taibaiensis]|nr:hypothetical protein [Solirubrobacter taibaiensis]
GGAAGAGGTAARRGDIDGVASVANGGRRGSGGARRAFRLRPSRFTVVFRQSDDSLRSFTRVFRESDSAADAQTARRVLPFLGAVVSSAA